MTDKRPAVAVESIEKAILAFRGERVLLDADLAKFYGVTTGELNQAVKRNRDRFPPDFMFQLSKEEFENWKSQIVISNPAAKMALRRPPNAFTELGVAMLSSVLGSHRAVQVNIEIMRAFVRLRNILAVNAELARRLDDLEKRVGKHDEQFVQVVRAIRQLMEPPAAAKRQRIGFRVTEEHSTSDVSTVRTRKRK